MNTSRWARKDPEPPIEPAAQPSVKPEVIQTPVATTTEIAPVQPNHEEQHYIPQDESVDEFAQTRPPDDLFDDDFVPIDEPIATEAAQPIVVEEVQIAESLPTPAPPSAPRGRGAPRGPRRGNNTSRHAPASARTVETPTEPAPAVETDSPDAPKPERREAAVRGDRSGTGGPKRSKLTEEELSAKLDAMKIKNATLMERHEKSQADEELFHQREAEAAQKRKEERVNRQQMMGERERNRLRKLKAQGGREWDIEKDEKEFDGSERRGNRRGAHGGVVNDRPAVTSQEPINDHRHGASERGRGRGRGRGGRGDSGARGRDSQSAAKSRHAPDQPVPTVNDFPDLPAAKKTGTSTTEPTKILELPLKKSNQKSETETLAALGMPGEKTSWADQVEQSS